MSGGPQADDGGRDAQVADYCRQIETYLCQKNAGHLVRVVGPAFELVSRWAADGVPLKVAFRGIDRHCERHPRTGPRRRPVRIDFCEADVLDVFDEWRRAVGLGRARVAEPAGNGRQDEEADRARRGPSLPLHLERVLIRLTNARATGALSAAGDEAIDRVSLELDAARASANGLRGAARQTLIARLAEIDRELLTIARDSLGEAERQTLEAQADQELAAFRASMAREAYIRAREAALDSLIRERIGLPIVTYR